MSHPWTTLLTYKEEIKTKSRKRAKSISSTESESTILDEILQIPESPTKPSRRRLLPTIYSISDDNNDSDDANEDESEIDPTSANLQASSQSLQNPEDIEESSKSESSDNF